uniref:THO complex 6 n=1 Tax=Lepisosteus oculatus TaxID=7918 RepID=W5LVJ1_LEPOC
MGPVELLHMSVFSQSFSPCSRFLAAGNNYGEIAIFSLCSALSPEATESSQRPILTFKGITGLSRREEETAVPVCACVPVCLCACVPVCLLSLSLPGRSSLEIPEINAMVINPRDNSLLVGGGDNNIHIMDLESGAFKMVMQGHTDYIHCLSLREREGEVLSGGEDGSVRVWDPRSGSSVHCIEVYKYEDCARPQYGKWISCLTTDSDWMLCGGGPSLSLWHLRSITPTTVFPLSGCQRDAAFYQDLILSVGDSAFLSHCQLNGEPRAHIPCTPQSLYTLGLNTRSSEHRVLTVGGSSGQIDVFTNFSYRAFSLSF